MVIISLTNKPFISVRWKIVLVYLAMLLVVLVAIVYVVIRLTGNYLISQRAGEEMAQVDILALRMASMLDVSDMDGIYQLCEDTVQENGGRILVLSSEGTVVADSHSLFNGMEITTAEVYDILNLRMNRSYGFHNLDAQGQNQWYGYYASAIIYNGQRIGLVLYASSVMDLVLQLDSLQMVIQIYFFSVLVIVLFLGFIISDYISRPINKLNNALLQTTHGDFTVRADAKGNDEISELARTFNMMTEKLENLDATRNRFISNASHELKTPLSAIKVLVENILLQPDDEMDPEMVRDFLTDVDKEVDRMTVMVSDLLTLVQMDSGAVTLRLAPAQLSEIVEETVKRLRPLAQSRNITIQARYEENPTVLADRLRLGQVLYNLIDNSIKYARADGHVIVTVDRSESDAIVTVQDDGIGIPEKDLPNLFDRFYRVDKARSRATGGTGLGLSIVREMVHLHHGRITVESQEGIGTCFTIRLPLPEKETAND